MTLEEERIVKRFLDEPGGFEFLDILRRDFCRTTCPSDAIASAFQNGQSAVIMRLYNILAQKK